MNKLYISWLAREARERFGKHVDELTDDDLRAIEGPPVCVSCDRQISDDQASGRGLCMVCLNMHTTERISS